MRTCTPIAHSSGNNSVCLVVDGLYLANGKAYQTRLLAEKLHQAGVEVVIINISSFLKPGSSCSPECKVEKGEIFSLPPEIEVTEIVSHKQLTKQLWLTRKKYKTVCFVGNYFAATFKRFLFLKALRKKTVIRFTSRYQPIETPWHRKHWLMVDRLIAVSRALENDLRESSSPGAFRKVVTILNRVHPKALRELDSKRKKVLRHDLGLDEAEKIVIFVGGIQYSKGIDLLLDAWGLIRKQVPQTRLLLVGPICSLCSRNVDYPGITHEGKKMLAEKMEIFSSKLAGLVRNHEKISCLGVKTNVSDYLEAADLFVFPSRTEGTPNALLEAMAAGLPVVTFDNKEIIGEIVRHNQEGILVPYEDFKGLAEAAVSLLENERTRQRLGFNARKRFKEELVFDDRQTKRFLEVFRT